MSHILPIFDAIDFIHLTPSHITHAQMEDYRHSKDFLKSYKGSKGTFNSYRREVERLLQWCWQIGKKNLTDLKRDDIEAFIGFCQNPPHSWIGLNKVPRFIEIDGIRQPNPAWRPFVVHVKKSAHKKGARPKIEEFALSAGAIKEMFAILSTYFNFLMQEEYISLNPVALIRQKSKYIQRQQGEKKIRRLSDTQWHYVIQTAKENAVKNPTPYERHVFILSLLYALYLRISELTASPRWIPTMNNFHKDQDDLWWFETVGKGNKSRRIAVSDAMLDALKRWRRYLELSPLPSLADESPLLPKQRGNGPITNTSYLRKLVQSSFDEACEKLKADGHIDEAESLMEATVHWLRHTGISDDVKHRPREHVRDDAGHSSSATTDKYIDIEIKARHHSARNKTISPD